ncbi:MAG: hypothetical protein ACK450_05180 [Sphingomonadales bacterium]|jgi:hypothetical protein
MKISDIANRIKIIKPIHKIVILIFIGSLIYNVSNDVSDYYKNGESLSSYRIEACQSENVGRPDATRACIKKIKSEESEWAQSYIQENILGLSIIHIIFFPLYLIIYNILVFIFLGYKSKYKLSEMNFIQKSIHFTGMAYVFLVIFSLYLTYDYISYRLKVPVTLFGSQVSINSVQATVRGVWVKDIYQNEDVTLKNVARHFGRNDEQYTLDSHLIQCSRDTMTCAHTEISISSVGSSKFLQPFEQSESRITEWKENSIMSEVDYECFVDTYTFDDMNDTGIWLRLSKDKPECSNRDIAPGGYKLWDGLELESKLRTNETRYLLKMLFGIFD